MVNWKGFLFLSFILDPHVYLWFCTFISLLFYALMNVRSTKGSTFIFSDIVLHNKSKWMEKKEKTIFNSWIWRPISCIQEEIIFEPAILHSFSTDGGSCWHCTIALPGQLAIPRAWVCCATLTPICLFIFIFVGSGSLAGAGLLHSVSEASAVWVVTRVVSHSVIMTLTDNNNLDKEFMECNEADSPVIWQKLWTRNNLEQMTI